MKPLKFRIWNKNAKEFVTDNRAEIAYLDILSLSKYIYDYSVFPKYLAIQQFTGHLDKNGKEIYEGDLIKFMLPGSPHLRESEFFASEEVWWDGFEWVAAKEFYDGYHGYSFRDMKEVELVGNIFEKTS